VILKHNERRHQENCVENGCPKCEAWASDTTLKITHPELAPRAVAAALFSQKTTIVALKKAGFKKVSIDQGGGAFSYKIE